MTVTAPPTCSACGAVLSRYNEGDLCAACERAAPALEVPDADRLLFAIAALLFARPGASVHLREELSARGVYADHIDVQCAVKRLRRRGLVIEATPRQAGYRLTAWRPRWHRRRG